MLLRKLPTKRLSECGCESRTTGGGSTSDFPVPVDPTTAIRGIGGEAGNIVSHRRALHNIDQSFDRCPSSRRWQDWDQFSRERRFILSEAIPLSFILASSDARAARS